MATRQKVSQCINSGMENLLQGNIQAAIVALDEAERLDPAIDPWLWQRGLAYYFADMFEEGANQFERDMAVNSRDTEESVWRFLCHARGHNLEFARSNLILPTEGDTRVPMYQALKLFQGTGTQEQVLEAVEKEPEGRKRQKAQFYGYYYVQFRALRSNGKRQDSDCFFFFFLLFVCLASVADWTLLRGMWKL
jgi:lipoprotein NlpI